MVVIMKNVVSAYIERWNLVLGVIFVLIVLFMPDGLVPGSRAPARCGAAAARAHGAAAAPPAGAAEPRGCRDDAALEVAGLCKSFGGLRSRARSTSRSARGERRLIIGPNGAGKTTLFNLITGEMPADQRLASACSAGTSRANRTAARAHLGMARTYQIITLFRRDTLLHNVMLALLGLSPLRWTPLGQLRRPTAGCPSARARCWTRSACGHMPQRPLAQTSYGEKRRARDRDGAGAEPEAAAARRAVRRPVVDERATIAELLAGIPRDITIVMIEHNMDVALDFADRITLLHYGEVIVEARAPQVVADPRTREIYLGH